MRGLLQTSYPELNLSLTLDCGQCFRWKKRKSNDDKVIWFGIIRDHVFNLTQKANGSIEWELLNTSFHTPKKKKLESKSINLLLLDYFQLSVCLVELYKRWSTSDEHFSKIGLRFPGIRILRQDPVENLFSFICSSNNNIIRISKMVEILCRNYGKFLMYDEEFGEIHSFPNVSSLSSPEVETNLRKLNFGYRAKFIQKTAEAIINKAADSDPEKWLYALRKIDYEDAYKTLISLDGVGAKVADCICLMSLDQRNAIPVDTHVWQIAKSEYLKHLKTKTLTAKSYKEIGNFFRGKFGEYAGWAHSVLFCAHLRKFKDNNFCQPLI